MENYITQERCEAYRKECHEHTTEQDTEITIIKTELGFVKKMMWMILGVLVSGFAGTIYAVLSLGK